MNKSSLSGVYCLALLLCTVAPAWAAEPSSSTNPATTNPQHVNYPLPYLPPTPEKIVQVLDRLHARLDAGTPARIIDSKTRERITDLSKPNENATLDSGPEKKFSSYSYPMGVIYSGMLLSSEVTGDKKYADFAARRYQFFADNLPALAKWPREEMRKNPFRNMLAPTSLDACGAMGASMARAARSKVGPDLKEVIDRFAEYVHTKQFRLDDGLLARKSPFPKSIWLDDAYMSVPLLAQYGKLTGDHKYFDDAAKQLKGFHKHLFVPETGLFTHAGNADVGEEHPHYFWGRANGWYMVAMVELLDLLPEDHADRAELIRILKAHAKGVATRQSGAGLWHQMLDRADSYLETSCTAMFSYSMAKGVNRGWLDASTYGPVAIAGWNGVTTRIDDEGHLDGVCVGTNYANDMVYYYNSPAMDDVHGYGPVLLCGAEMFRLMKNDQLEITGSPTRPVLILKKKESAQ
ncbi:MAG: unsaturated rhamnogalacturonyl hydrolase [Phycisphaerales bacterium]|nr:unsaturated rhamnogalacturonyl hydrolase [Phycisphaerales bacterium]